MSYYKQYSRYSKPNCNQKMCFDNFLQAFSSLDYCFNCDISPAQNSTYPHICMNNPRILIISKLDITSNILSESKTA